MSEAATLLGLLADDDRLRVVAALVLGATTSAEVRAATSLDSRAVGRALARLEDAGVVVSEGETWHVDLAPLQEAARVAAPVEEYEGTDAETAKVLRSFLRDGRLVRMPAHRSKRRVLLDHVVQVFEPGQRYTEKEVDALLRAFSDDYVTIRRYLVDEDLLSRDHGVYWRSGGTFAL